MTRAWINICLLTAFSLTLGVIWPDCSAAGQVQFERLGQIRDGLRVPARLDVDALGNLYVVDSRVQQVVKFDRFGRQVNSVPPVPLLLIATEMSMSLT